MPREPKTRTRCLFVYATMAGAGTIAAVVAGTERAFLPGTTAVGTGATTLVSRGRFDEGFDPVVSINTRIRRFNGHVDEVKIATGKFSANFSNSPFAF